MPHAPTEGAGAKVRVERDFPRYLGDVELISRVATDARGETFIGARAEGVERLCLVYLPASARVMRPTVLDDLKSQASWLVRRVHGNLVQVFDVQNADGRIFFASELVEGRDLRAVRERLETQGRTAPGEIWVQVAMEVASAIEFVRINEEKATGVATTLAGMTGRSVLLGVDGAVKVNHLGSSLAQSLDNLSDPETVALVPPECLRGAAWSPHADVFAVGALLWRCLSGRALVADVNQHFHAARSGTWKPPALVEDGAVVAEAAVEQTIPGSEDGPASMRDDPEQRRRTLNDRVVVAGVHGDDTRPVVISLPAMVSAARAPDDQELSRKTTEGPIEAALLDPVPVVAAPVKAAPVDAELEALVMSALDPDPKRRPRDIATFRTSLAAFNKSHSATAGIAAVRALVTDLFGKELAAEAAQFTAWTARLEESGHRGGPSSTLTTFETMRRRTPIHTDDDLGIGETIPGTRYKVLAKLGEGGMGTVYAAEHVDIERRVALKLLHADLLRNPHVLQQFRQEARAASKIGNPYICDVTDWGEVPDGRVFFVMEFVDGASLSHAIRKSRRMPAARILPIMRQIAKALAAAHDKGIVHLDLKPDNVLLHEKEGRIDAVKVVDFGIASLMGQGGPESKVMGTPEYMAPERIAGRGADRSCDIYALGVMAYEMLAGEAPFQAATPVETLAMHSMDRPTPFAEKLVEPIAPAVEAVIFRMLEKDPYRRQATMQEVEIALVEAQIASGIRTPWDEHLTLPPMDAVRLDEIRRGFRNLETPRWRRPEMIGAAAAVLGVLALVVFLNSDDGDAGKVSTTDEPTPPVAVAPVAALAESEKTVAIGNLSGGAGRAPAPEAVVGGGEKIVAPEPGSAETTVASRPPSGVAPIRAGAAKPSSPTAASKAATGGGASRAVQSKKPAAQRAPETGGTPAGPAAANGQTQAQAKEVAERGHAALQAGRIVQAEKEFKNALALDGNSAAALAGLAEVAFEESRYAEAASLARRALRLDPRRARCAVIMGDAFYKLGQFDESLSAYERALAADPGDAPLKMRIDRVKARVN